MRGLNKQPGFGECMLPAAPTDLCCPVSRYLIASHVLKHILQSNSPSNIHGQGQAPDNIASIATLNLLKAAWGKREGSAPSLKTRPFMPERIQIATFLESVPAT